MSNQVKDLVQQSQHQVVELAAKGSIGVVGTLTSMSINDWAGLIVAFLTGVYMCFQIESAWRNRVAAKETQKAVIQDQK
jgi:hypothetical protein